MNYCAALVGSGEGILAAHKSLLTIEKRFKSIGSSSSEGMRRNLLRHVVLDNWAG